MLGDHSAVIHSQAHSARNIHSRFNGRAFSKMPWRSKTTIPAMMLSRHSSAVRSPGTQARCGSLLYSPDQTNRMYSVSKLNTLVTAARIQPRQLALRARACASCASTCARRLGTGVRLPEAGRVDMGASNLAGRLNELLEWHDGQDVRHA